MNTSWCNYPNPKTFWVLVFRCQEATNYLGLNSDWLKKHSYSKICLWYLLLFLPNCKCTMPIKIWKPFSWRGMQKAREVLVWKSMFFNGTEIFRSVNHGRIIGLLNEKTAYRGAHYKAWLRKGERQVSLA